MNALEKFNMDCYSEGLGKHNINPVQMNYLKSQEEIYCSSEQLTYHTNRLRELKAKGEYPQMDPHEGYGDIDKDAQFICSCNALHINADNGIQIGTYVLDKNGNYVPKHEYTEQNEQPKWYHTPITYIIKPLLRV